MIATSPTTFHLEMSSEKSSVKKKRSSFSIIAVAKRKKRKSLSLDQAQDQAAPLESASAADTSKSVEYTEIHLERPRAQFKQANSAQVEAQVIELQKELEAAREDMSTMQNEVVQDKETIAVLEAKLREAETQASELAEKVTKYESISENLDDDSFGAAQEFQLKQQISELKAKLEKREELEQELQDARVELTALRSENEELQLQQQRSTTRSRIQSISQEKSSRDEVFKLQKDIRQLERDHKKETSLLEAQLRVAQDSIQRAQEKTLGVQRRLDEMDKERSQLKIENKRLERKLEKSGSYAERKRQQMEAESHELEIANLRRKNAKLERRLGSTDQLNLTGLGIDMDDTFSLSSSVVSSGRTSPIPETLSEARIAHLEKEVAQLEMQASKLESENINLKGELVKSKQNEELLSSRVKLTEEEVVEEKQELEQVKAEVGRLRAQAAVVAGSPEEIVQEQQLKLQKLEKMLADKETEFRVKEKDLWARIEALKRQVDDLEIAKLKAELGEDEDGAREEEDLTDVEDEADSKNKTNVEELRGQLSSLQTELDAVKAHNVELQTGIETQMQESRKFMKALESAQIELDSIKYQNEELQAKVASSKQEAEGESTELLESEVTSLQDQLNSLQKELDMAESYSEELQAEVERYKKEAESSKLQLQSAEESDLRDQIDSLQNELDLAESYSEELQADITRYKQEAESTKAQHSSEIEGLREQLYSLESELDMVQAHKEELLADVARYKQEAGSTKVLESQEVNSFRKQVTSLQMELDVVKSRNEELEAENKRQKEKAEQLMKSLESKLDNDQSRADELTKKNAELTKNLKEESKKYEDAIREISRLKEIIEDQVCFHVRKNLLSYLDVNSSMHCLVVDGELSTETLSTLFFGFLINYACRLTMLNEVHKVWQHI